MIFDFSALAKTITGLTADSRKVAKGNLFVAIPGTKMDGRQFIADAVAKGASHIVVPKGTPRPDGLNVIWIESDDPQHFLSFVASAFYGAQPRHIVAVTGTNGKTSTVNFARMIWSALGYKSASLGTLGLVGEGLVPLAGMTTPDAVSLFSTLADISRKGFTHLAMEASSHGLQQHRLDGVRIESAGFTNLTRDHLDYHVTMENYLAAKIRLFTEVVADGGAAVINADLPETEYLVSRAGNRSLKVITYGLSDAADIRIVGRQAVSGGQNLDILAFGNAYKVHLPLVGAFQAMNALCAAGLVLGDGKATVDDVMDALTTVHGVHGRLQPVPDAPDGIGVYIDYAHTPDGLETILKALRPHTTGRLICVFGCGGDRDKGKRPVMGEIAARLADHVIVTDDNPRSEDPSVIRAEIMSAAKGAIEIGGRRNAIHAAVHDLRAGDVLVIAGKGHEQGQIFATHTEPFDDLTETQSALRHFFQ